MLTGLIVATVWIPLVVVVCSIRRVGGRAEATRDGAYSSLVDVEAFSRRLSDAATRSLKP